MRPLAIAGVMPVLPETASTRLYPIRIAGAPLRRAVVNGDEADDLSRTVLTRTGEVKPSWSPIQDQTGETK